MCRSLALIRLPKAPFGSFGDLALIPDPATRFTLNDDADIFDFALGDIRSLEGEPWAYCTRSIAKRAIDELKAVSGSTPLSAFEHEFQLKNLLPRAGDGFGLKGFRDAKEWSQPFLSALRDAGCVPDTFMKEYGPSTI